MLTSHEAPTSTMTNLIISIVSFVVMEMGFTNVEAQATIDPRAYYNTTYNSGMTADLRDMLLFEYNDFRRQEFTSSDMNMIDWSVSLEAEAAEWVQRCQFGKQDDRPWGENLYRSTYKTTDENTISNAVLAWTLERYNIMSSPTGYVDCCSEAKKTCCYYTQMVWAQTEYMGCAMRHCDVLKGEVEDDDFIDAIYLACYFYPQGNDLTKQPFQTGPNGPCTECSSTNPDCNDGLCFFDKTTRC